MSLVNSIRSVIENDNCSGCGGCTLVSSRVTMALDDQGFLRPLVGTNAIAFVDDAAEAALFRATCPGVGLRAPSDPTATRYDSTFGDYVSAWEGWAIDPAVRYAGSSAGVLTALADWLVSTGLAPLVVGSAADRNSPSRTVPVRIMSRDEALASAGSRYAPVANLVEYVPDGAANALIGKPCEVSAASQFHEARALSTGTRPIMLSFFCAGTPSQRATDQLSEKLGMPVGDVSSLRYRGNGWPGAFAITSKSGVKATMTYDDSWGKHLGRDLQWRCKFCVDGTGGHSDISVGDYWRADENGYPLFDSADGVSAIIVRTALGKLIFDRAVAEGVIFARPLSLNRVAEIQPLQRDRKRTLLGRLAGRILAGKRVPHYRGYLIGRLFLSSPLASARSMIGTFRRSVGKR